MDFGRAIRVARAIRGLAQKDLAQLAGSTSPMVSAIEAGDKTPSLTQVLTLARAMNISIDLIIMMAQAHEKDFDWGNMAVKDLADVGRSFLAAMAGDAGKPCVRRRRRASKKITMKRVGGE